MSTPGPRPRPLPPHLVFARASSCAVPGMPADLRALALHTTAQALEAWAGKAQSLDHTLTLVDAVLTSGLDALATTAIPLFARLTAAHGPVPPRHFAWHGPASATAGHLLLAIFAPLKDRVLEPGEALAQLLRLFASHPPTDPTAQALHSVILALTPDQMPPAHAPMLATLRCRGVPVLAKAPSALHDLDALLAASVSDSAWLEAFALHKQSVQALAVLTALASSKAVIAALRAGPSELERDPKLHATTLHEATRLRARMPAPHALRGLSALEQRARLLAHMEDHP